MSKSEKPKGDCGYVVGDLECIRRLLEEEDLECPGKYTCCITGMKEGLIVVPKGQVNEVFINGKIARL
ncbi:hypothetical protein L6279_04870 [Candidatus Parcubacteria bacterium]|nr:hypothetical protein [Patescibacteria group bacterium]MCG2693396.1 hypothetical protein [Candidatus Parcubacteria bacterium]